MTLNLSPGEQVMFEGHPSWRSIIGFYLKGLVLAAIAGFGAALVTRITDGEVKGGVVFIVVLIVLALTLLIGFLKRIATTYTITDRRLHIKRGIVAREIQETRLERVQNVNYHQSVYQRMVGIGDVDFDTAAGDDYDFSFTGVARPGEVVHRVDQATATGAAGSHGLGEPQPAPETETR